MTRETVSDRETDSRPVAGADFAADLKAQLGGSNGVGAGDEAARRRTNRELSTSLAFDEQPAVRKAKSPQRF
jgi:hypothetical protein